VAAIEALREKSPEKYSEIAARLIATIEPKQDSWDECKDMQSIGRKLLRSVGVDEFQITDDMVVRALAANDVFVDELARIAQEAIQ
jgi:hypothetical protein